jgi:DNA polymerase-3 subunit delta'
VSFKDIVGQEQALGILSGIMKMQKLATSYLFSGEPGIGKKMTAINFAKALNCQGSRGTLNGSRDEMQDEDEFLIAGNASEFDACDSCSSCMKIESNIHPDFLLISPEERQIRIDEIRMVEESLSYRPFEAKKKIVIVDDADTMNISAANAFLKTLEEPPEQSIIILISSRPDRLPDTIRSRCSRIHFNPLSSEACRNVLRGRVSEETLDLVTALSLGMPGAALADDLIEEKKWFLGLFESMLNAEKDNWSSREEMDRWFELVLYLLRDIAVIKVAGKEANLIHGDLYEHLEGLGNSIDLIGIINIHHELTMLKNLFMFNLNKSITWNYTSALLRKELTVSDA